MGLREAKTEKKFKMFSRIFHVFFGHSIDLLAVYFFFEDSLWLSLDFPMPAFSRLFGADICERYFKLFIRGDEWLGVRIWLSCEAELGGAASFARIQSIFFFKSLTLRGHYGMCAPCLSSFVPFCIAIIGFLERMC